MNNAARWRLRRESLHGNWTKILRPRDRKGPYIWDDEFRGAKRAGIPHAHLQAGIFS